MTKPNPIQLKRGKGIYDRCWSYTCDLCDVDSRIFGANILAVPFPTEQGIVLDHTRDHLRKVHGYGTCTECGRITRPGFTLHTRCLFRAHPITRWIKGLA